MTLFFSLAWFNSILESLYHSNPVAGSALPAVVSCLNPDAWSRGQSSHLHREKHSTWGQIGQIICGHFSRALSAVNGTFPVGGRDGCRIKWVKKWDIFFDNQLSRDFFCLRYRDVGRLLSAATSAFNWTQPAVWNVHFLLSWHDKHLENTNQTSAKMNVGQRSQNSVSMLIFRGKNQTQKTKRKTLWLHLKATLVLPSIFLTRTAGTKWII